MTLFIVDFSLHQQYIGITHQWHVGTYVFTVIISGGGILIIDVIVIVPQDVPAFVVIRIIKHHGTIGTGIVHVTFGNASFFQKFVVHHVADTDFVPTGHAARSHPEVEYVLVESTVGRTVGKLKFQNGLLVPSNMLP